MGRCCLEEIKDVSIVVLCKKKNDYRQAFRYCDADGSGGIDMTEFQNCANFPTQVGNKKKDATQEIFRLFDSNKNNVLSRPELKAFLKVITEHEQEVDVVLEDGSKQTMMQTDFMKMAEERTKGMKMEDGKVTRVDEGSAELDLLKKDNPELARFIIMGQWAREMIATMGYANGAIHNVKSLDENLPYGDSSYQAPSARFLEVKLKLSMRENERPESDVLEFEVWIEWNPDAYARPHLAMKKLYLLSLPSQGHIDIRREELQTPQAKKASFWSSQPKWVQACTLSAAVALLLAVCMGGCFFARRTVNEAEEGNNSSERLDRDKKKDE